MKKLAFLFGSLAIAWAFVLGALAACGHSQAPPRPLFAAAVPTATTTAVSTGPGATCPLGFIQSDINSSTCSTAFGWTPFYADAGVAVGPAISLTPGDDAFITVQTSLETPNAADNTGHCWYQTKWGVAYLTDGGAILSPTGVDAGVTQDSQCGSGFAGLPAPTLLQFGNSVQLWVNSPVAGAIKGNVDWTRGAQAPFVLSVSPSSLSTDAGGTVTVTTTPGGAQYASSAVLGATVASDGGVSGGVAVNCSQATDHTATCVSPPGAGLLPDGGLVSGGVALTSQAGPFPMAGGFAYSAGGGAGGLDGGAGAPNEWQYGPDLGSSPWASWHGHTGTTIAQTSTGSPTTTTLNSLTAAAFLGSSTQTSVSASSVCGAGPITVAVAFQSASYASTQGIVTIEPGGNPAARQVLYINATSIAAFDGFSNPVLNFSPVNGDTYFAALVSNTASTILAAGEGGGTLTTTTGTQTPISATSNLIYLAQYNSNDYLTGKIGEVEVWCAALTVPQLTSVYGNMMARWGTQ